MSHPLLSVYYLMPKLSLIGGYACVSPSKGRLAVPLCVVRFWDDPALLFRAEDIPVSCMLFPPACLPRRVRFPTY